MNVRRALLSTYDKTGLAELATALAEMGIEIVSTGGTADVLEDAGIKVTPVTEVTGHPELFGGRVKTLHPNIHAAILARRDVASDMDTLEEMGVAPIDLVVANLYPFQETAEQGTDLDEAMNTVDIGGPTLVRAAAKNHEHCAPVVHPSRYEAIVDELDPDRELSGATRRALAVEAFDHTAHYDAVIGKWLRETQRTGKFPQQLSIPLDRVQPLRYGENDHQEAAFYETPLASNEPCIPRANQLHGKELSYNNILDADAALEAVKEFDEPAVAIIKHATPSGIALGDTIQEAYQRAYETDTDSPYGGIVAANQPIDEDAAQAMSELFLEVILAPSFTQDALEILTEKKNVRLLEIPWNDDPRRGLAYRSVVGGAIVQDRDVKELDPDTWDVVTDASPTQNQIDDMLFAMRCVRHIKSNSVVFVKDGATVGIGTGQTSRVDASWIATNKGGDRIQDSVLASDAFFPFRDAVDVAVDAGVSAIIEPGGSIRDDEVIEAANEHGIPMVFSHQRAFRH